MISNLILKELRHQTVQRTTTGCQRLQDRRAIFLPLESLLDRRDLATNSPDTVQKFLLVLNRVSQ